MYTVAPLHIGKGSRWRRWPVRGPNRRNNAYDTRRGSEATELPCFAPSKDVVLP